MAKILKEFPEQTGSGRPKYPWNDWLDGRVWQLQKGEDFTIGPEHFRIGACQAARKRGLKLRANVKEDTVIIQAQKIE